MSVEETLSRHRTILEKFCKDKKINVVEVLEEVVSGEVLAVRPKMMRLLEQVNTGMYNGAVCMEQHLGSGALPENAAAVSSNAIRWRKRYRHSSLGSSNSRKPFVSTWKRVCTPSTCLQTELLHCPGKSKSCRNRKLTFGGRRNPGVRVSRQLWRSSL